MTREDEIAKLAAAYRSAERMLAEERAHVALHGISRHERRSARRDAVRKIDRFAPLRLDALEIVDEAATSTTARWALLELARQMVITARSRPDADVERMLLRLSIDEYRFFGQAHRARPCTLRGSTYGGAVPPKEAGSSRGGRTAAYKAATGRGASADQTMGEPDGPDPTGRREHSPGEPARAVPEGRRIALSPGNSPRPLPSASRGWRRPEGTGGQGAAGDTAAVGERAVPTYAEHERESSAPRSDDDGSHVPASLGVERARETTTVGTARHSALRSPPTNPADMSTARAGSPGYDPGREHE